MFKPQVTAGNDTIVAGTIDMGSREQGFELNITKDMVPEATLLVWYIYQGELVADAVRLPLDEMAMDQVEFNIEWS